MPQSRDPKIAQLNRPQPTNHPLSLSGQRRLLRQDSHTDSKEAPKDEPVILRRGAVKQTLNVPDLASRLGGQATWR